MDQIIRDMGEHAQGTGDLCPNCMEWYVQTWAEDPDDPITGDDADHAECEKCDWTSSTFYFTIVETNPHRS